MNLISRRRLFLAAVVVTIVACGEKSSPEQQVRAVIAEAERSAEARDLSAAMHLVSDEYSDRGGRDKSQLRDFLRGYFVLNQSIHLLTRVEAVEFPAEELARAKVTVGMLGTRGGESEDWSLAADVYEFDVELVREGSEWRLLHAEWKGRR